METIRKRLDKFYGIIDEMPCMSSVTKNILKDCVGNISQLSVAYGYMQALKGEKYEGQVESIT